MPVVRATARPDGDVIHEVKNGQSLWSIAIEYGVKIDQIRQLNNYSATEIYTGQTFLIQKSATQPATPTASSSATPTAGSTFTPQPAPSRTPTPQAKQGRSVTGQKTGIFVFGVIVIASLFSIAFFSAITRQKI
jgi:spore germination protein YaaH